MNDLEKRKAWIDGQPMKLGVLTRDMEPDETRAVEIDEEKRTVELSFSSEAEVKRWFGVEILDHSKRSVDLKRLNNGGPVLVNHDPAQQVGVVEKAWITDDRRGRAIVRFGRSALADEIFRDVQDGIRRHTSAGYRVHKLRREPVNGRKETSLEEGVEKFRAISWEPIEITIAYAGEDPTVGVGRAVDSDERAVEVEGLEKKMEVEKETQNGSNAGETAVESHGEEHRMDPKPEGLTPEELKDKLDGERAAERDRVRAILAVGEKFGKSDLARKFIDEGKPVDDFHRAVLDNLADASAKNQTRSTKSADDENPNDLGLSKRDLRDYSIVRAIRAWVNKKWHEGSLELECSRAIAERHGKEPQGFFVPLDVMADEGFLNPSRERSVQNLLLRVLQVSGGTGAGSNLVGDDHMGGSFIEYLRAQTVLGRLGMRIMGGLVGTVDIPRQTGSGSTAWVGEAGTTSESTLTLDTVQMEPHTVTAEQRMTRRLLLQSSPGIESLVRADIAGAVGLAVDTTGLRGDSGVDANQPDGIAATSGIGDVEFGAAGGAPTWTKMLEFPADVETADALMGSLGFVTTPLGKHKLMSTTKDSGSGQFLASDGLCAGYPLIATSQLRDTLAQGGSGNVLTEVFFGNFADLVMGMWGTFDLKPDEATLASSGGLVLRAFQDVDFAVRHAGSFSYSDDMDAS